MSNAPWAGTGYGVQTKLMLPALRELGHEPVCFAFYGLNGGRIVYDDYEVLPNSDFETWGNDVIKSHIERAEAEAVVTLMDLFVLDVDIWQTIPVPWFAWTPIDSDGIGDATLSRLKIVDEPVAMSIHGSVQMMAHDIDPTAIIYHAVDTDVYKPGDRSESRALLNSIPDDVFLVGMVMANKGDRKQFPTQLQAIKLFADRNPDIDVRIYVHTEPTAMMGGWDMRALVERVGLKGRVYSTNQYDVSVVPMRDEFMAHIFNSFDVLMNCSAGEGFGVPIIEAQACGIPVVTHGVTSMPELTVNGYATDSVAPLLSGHLGWQYIPSIEDMAYRLECVYRMSDKQKRIDGRNWVIKNCSVPVIAAQWDALLRGSQDQQEDAMATARVKL
jgi:glycosyltransferase involved in cell wall biosynthesis